MPVYGDTYYSPKMERPGSRNSRKGLSFGRIVGDPFALASISIAVLAWLIALVASIIADIHTTYTTYSWWTIAYTAVCIIGVTLMIAADVVFTYHVAAVGFMANGLFLTTSSINALIYSPDGASEAAAAGFILLAIVMAIWIFYFGSQPQASHRRFIDSFALHKSNDESLRASRMPTSQNFGPSNPGFPTSNPTQSAAFSSNHLRGLETSSPLTATNNSTFMSESQPRFGGPTNNNTLSSTMPYQDVTQHEAPGVPAPTEYPYKARAIYSYEANPDDANEISFQKHEILEVSDVSGRWWQAKKSSGETGIAPSNYLILL